MGEIYEELALYKRFVPVFTEGHWQLEKCLDFPAHTIVC